jgi:hypothetical protein
MTDGVPLAQILEPGEYRVKWTIPTQTGDFVLADGDLMLRANGLPSANGYDADLVTYEVHGDSLSAEFPQTYDAGSIRGQLLNGGHVVLVDATIEVWMENRAMMTARYALVGKSEMEADSLKAFALRVQVEGLDAIAGLPPIYKVKHPRGPDTSKVYLDWDWGVTGRPESTQKWSDEHAEMSLWFLNTVNAPEGFFFRLSFSPVVDVAFTEPQSLEAVMESWVNPLRSIVALSTGRKERVTYLSVSVGDVATDRRGDFQVFGFDLHQSPYASRNNDILKIERSFLISPEHESLLDLSRTWQRLAEEHHPLLETYGSLLFAADQHPRSRFLLLIQAIEGLHGFETRAAYDERLSDHGARRAAALDEAVDHVSDTTAKFLRKFVMKRPPANLDQAITATLAGAPVNAVSTLEQLDLITEMMSDDRSTNSVAECIRIVRNDLAHGNRGYNARKLYEVVVVLDRVVQAHLLRTLGCSVKAQKIAQERRR